MKNFSPSGKKVERLSRKRLTDFGPPCQNLGISLLNSKRRLRTSKDGLTCMIASLSLLSIVKTRDLDHGTVCQCFVIVGQMGSCRAQNERISALHDESAADRGLILRVPDINRIRERDHIAVGFRECRLQVAEGRLAAELRAIKGAAVWRIAKGEREPGLDRADGLFEQRFSILDDENAVGIARMCPLDAQVESERFGNAFDGIAHQQLVFSIAIGIGPELGALAGRAIVARGAASAQGVAHGLAASVARINPRGWISDITDLGLAAPLMVAIASAADGHAPPLVHHERFPERDRVAISIGSEKESVPDLDAIEVVVKAVLP